MGSWWNWRRSGKKRNIWRGWSMIEVVVIIRLMEKLENAFQQLLIWIRWESLLNFAFMLCDYQLFMIGGLKWMVVVVCGLKKRIFLPFICVNYCNYIYLRFWIICIIIVVMVFAAKQSNSILRHPIAANLKIPLQDLPFSRIHHYHSQSQLHHHDY